MSILVTGAYGFIGSNLVRALNERGEADIVVVDNLTRAEKFHNLVDCQVSDYFDKVDFLARLQAGQLRGRFTAVLHQGACSDTLGSDGRYMMENNTRFSVALLDHCQEERIPLVYASSAATYGSRSGFREDPSCEAPLNIYGYSKLLFDQIVRRRLPQRTAPIVGLRYFNVYGPRETHKGRMASVALHAYQQLREQGFVRLFEGSHGYGPGEQSRDFVHVDDVARVNLWCLDHPEVAGIFNLGTGRAQPFNDVAHTVVNTCRALDGQPELSLEQLVDEGSIRYVAFPPDLAGRYQAYTQADLAGLRGAGYDAPFLSVEQGVRAYVEWLHQRAVAPGASR